MYWRFGFQSTPAIELLIEREGVTVEELLNDEELLQECKSQNKKLLDL